MRNPIMWSDPFNDSGKLLIEHSVQEIIGPYVQDTYGKPEAGGILLGFRRGAHIHIVSATVPQFDDHRSRFHFVRKDQHHQDEAFRMWHASGEKMDYLGEWHTHPELNPTPSTHDCDEWQKIATYRAVPMVFLIIGIRNNLWVGIGNSNYLRQCEIYDDV